MEGRTLLFWPVVTLTLLLLLLACSNLIIKSLLPKKLIMIRNSFQFRLFKNASRAGCKLWSVNWGITEQEGSQETNLRILSGFSGNPEIVPSGERTWSWNRLVIQFHCILGSTLGRNALNICGQNFFWKNFTAYCTILPAFKLVFSNNYSQLLCTY
jgi:hypothetical protein